MLILRILIEDINFENVDSKTNILNIIKKMKNRINIYTNSVSLLPQKLKNSVKILINKFVKSFVSTLEVSTWSRLDSWRGKSFESLIEKTPTEN